MYFTHCSGVPIFNPLQLSVAFLYPDVFRGYRKATPGCNGLTLNKKMPSGFEHTYSRHWGHECVFWGTFFEKERPFCLLALPKQMSFLTISNENIFFKTQGTRLGATVAPHKGLE